MITKEDVLKLPHDEKIELLFLLQENLESENSLIENNKLSPELWAEIRKREKIMETGEAKWIGEEELVEFLKQRRNALSSGEE